MQRARRPLDLAALFEPEVNVAILERTHAGDFLGDVERAMRDVLPPNLMWTARPTAQGQRELNEHFAGIPGLGNDIAHAVELLADLTGASLVGIRLARVERAMCPRFHVDRVTLRCVVTYVGPGTQFVDGSLFDRSALAVRSHSIEMEAVHNQHASQHAATGDLVFLKGEGWPDNVGRGAVHRSPPASPEAPRLVLTLDAL